MVGPSPLESTDGSVLLEQRSVNVTISLVAVLGLVHRLCVLVPCVFLSVRGLWPHVRRSAQSLSRPRPFRARVSPRLADE